MRILWDNEFDKHTITPATEHAGYLAVNVQDTRLSRYTRTTAVDNQTWKINMTAALEFSCCVIAGHNITAAATIKIQASNNDFVAIPFESVIPHNAGHMIHFFTPGASYTDWRFWVHDPTNTDLYIKISRLFLGTYLTVEEGPYREFTDEPIDTSRVSTSQTGQVYGDKGIVLKRYSLEFKKWTHAMIVQIKTMFESIQTADTFFLLIDENNLDKLSPLYCRIEEHAGYSHLSYWIYRGSITFLEAR